jgi:hypothetical protein
MGFLATPGSNGKGWRGQSPYGEDCFALSGRSFDIVFLMDDFCARPWMLLRIGVYQSVGTRLRKSMHCVLSTVF